MAEATKQIRPSRLPGERAKISVYVTRDTERRLLLWAEMQGLSVSAAVRELIERGVRQPREAVPA